MYSGTKNHSVIALFGTIFVGEIKRKETLKVLCFCVLNYVIYYIYICHYHIICHIRQNYTGAFLPLCIEI